MRFLNTDPNPAQVKLALLRIKRATGYNGPLYDQSGSVGLRVPALSRVCFLKSACPRKPTFHRHKRPDPLWANCELAGDTQDVPLSGYSGRASRLQTIRRHSPLSCSFGDTPRCQSLRSQGSYCPCGGFGTALTGVAVPVTENDNTFPWIMLPFKKSTCVIVSGTFPQAHSGRSAGAARWPVWNGYLGRSRMLKRKSSGY